MSGPVAAAIYARISSDPHDERAGVDRQLADGRATAESLGWPVAGEYVDNSVSAFKDTTRPAYERMMADIAEGRIDAVIVWHMDRLTRRPIDLEHFLEVIDRAGVRHVRFVTGEADLTTGDGLLVARIMAAVAHNESATKSRRMKRRKQEDARQGRPTYPGYPRAFGYTADQMTIVPEEAETFRRLVHRLLAGETLRSLCVWLNDQAIATTLGNTWTGTSLRRMLLSARYAALSTYQGEVIGPATWPPIIDQETHDRIVAHLRARAATGRRTPRTHLLTGLLRCGRCGRPLYASARTYNTQTGSRAARRYVCHGMPDHDGCGRLAVSAEPLEALLTEAVLIALDGPAVQDAIRGASNTDASVTELRHALDLASERLLELADLYATKAITAAEWMRARDPIEAEHRRAQRRLTALTDSASLAAIAGRGDELRTTWPGLNLAQQHATIAAVITHATISPATNRGPAFNPARVNITWRG